MKTKKHQRNGEVSDMASLTFHDWFGRLQNRMKARVTDKDKGVMMIEQIQTKFGITEEFCRRKLLEIRMRDIEDQMEGPKWTRDEKGQIVSPFKSREWKDGM